MRIDVYRVIDDLVVGDIFVLGKNHLDGIKTIYKVVEICNNRDALAEIYYKKDNEFVKRPGIKVIKSKTIVGLTNLKHRFVEK